MVTSSRSHLECWGTSKYQIIIYHFQNMKGEAGLKPKLGQLFSSLFTKHQAIFMTRGLLLELVSNSKRQNNKHSNLPTAN